MSDNKKRCVAVYMRVAYEEPPKKITALYCRTARSDAEAITLQVNRLIKFASDNQYENCKLYIDDGELGNTLNRPVMNNLTDDIKAGKIDTVIACDMARLARDFILVNRWIEFLDDNNVNLITVNEGDMSESIIPKISEIILRNFQALTKA